MHGSNAGRAVRTSRQTGEELVQMLLRSILIGVCISHEQEILLRVFKL